MAGPGGSKPGERRGGRKKGTLNKITVARQQAAQLPSVIKAGGGGNRLQAVDALSVYLTNFTALMNKFKPKDIDDLAKWPEKHQREYVRWAKLGIRAAKELAPYQTEKAGQGNADEQPPTRGDISFTLTVFDSDGRTIVGQVLPPPRRDTRDDDEE